MSLNPCYRNYVAADDIIPRRIYKPAATAGQVTLATSATDSFSGVSAETAPLAGQRIGDINWPADTALVAILRDGRVIVPAKDDPLETGDELLFVTSEDVEDELATLLSGGHHHPV